MQTPIISIFASKNKNMTHYIYRSLGEPIKKDLEEFVSNRTPIGVVDEASSTSSTLQMRNVTMLKDNNPKGYFDFISLSLPFDFNLNTNEYYINLRNNVNATNDLIYKVSLGNNSPVSIEVITNGQIIKQYTSSEIGNLFLFKNNSILINKKLDFNYNVITFTGTISVYEFKDSGKKFEDVTPERGHGIYKPVLKVIETTKYYDFYQDADYRKNIYYYYVISKDNNGNISDISNTQVLEVAEPDIEFKLYESSDYYDNDSPTFNVVAGTAKSIEEIRIDKKDTSSDIVKTENIDIFPYAIDNENKRLVYITNVWNSDNRHLMNRNKKAYKGVNILNGIKAESQVFTFESSQEEILIDKIEILKKDVTALTEEERNKPIDYKDSNGTVLKVFIRQGGVYFSDFFTGKNIETNDYDYPEHLVSSITLNSRFPLMKINDTCIRGNKYNYTMYLYDKYRRKSEAIVKVI